MVYSAFKSGSISAGRNPSSRTFRPPTNTYNTLRVYLTHIFFCSLRSALYGVENEEPREKRKNAESALQSPPVTPPCPYLRIFPPSLTGDRLLCAYVKTRRRSELNLRRGWTLRMKDYSCRACRLPCISLEYLSRGKKKNTVGNIIWKKVRNIWKT